MNIDELRDIDVEFITHCTKTSPGSRYRIWIEKELWVEREWRWPREFFLEESMHLRVLPGQYKIRWEMVPGDSGNVSVRNFRVLGNSRAIIDDKGIITVV